MKYTANIADVGITLPLAVGVGATVAITPAIMAALVPNQAPATTTSGGKNRPQEFPSQFSVWARFTSAGAATVQVEFTIYRNGVAYTILSAGSGALGANTYDVEMSFNSSGAGFAPTGILFYLVTAGVRAAATSTTVGLTGLAFMAADDIKISLKPAVAALSITAGQIATASV